MSLLKIKTRWVPGLMNIIGLGIAFTVFLILMSQVWWDFRYDRFKGGKDVYVVDYPSPFDGIYTPSILRPAIQHIRDCSPDIEAACDYWGTKDDPVGRIQIKDKNGDYQTVRGIGIGVTETSVLDVFNITLLEGSRESFVTKGDALISESAARQFFPDRNPMGETVIYEWRNECRIVGVYKDRRENESMVNGILIHEGDTDLELPYYNPHFGYVKLKHGADIETVRRAVSKVDAGNSQKDFRLTKLHDYWFTRDKELWGTGGNKLMVYVLLTIAILFLAIAAFNYINFAMAAIPFKIKEINTRIVYGASRGSLVLRQLFLAIGLAGTAFLVAVLVMHILSGTSWASFLSGSMAPGDNLTVIGIGGVVALFIAIASGLVPALYSTSFQPALILKGSYSLSAKGGGLRTVTLILQYVLSFIFIISALILQRQTNYMIKNDDLGFDYERVLKMDSHTFGKVKEVADQIRSIPGVVDVTRGDSPIQEHRSSMTEIRDGDKVVQFSFRDVPPEYPGFFKLELREGRLPLPGENDVALVNESFVEALPSYGIGKSIFNYFGKSTVIGILKDFHARTFHHTYSPLVLFVGDDLNYNSFMIRIQPNADVQAILSQARKYYMEMRGLEEADIETGFLDKDIEKLYEQETRQTRLIKLSSLLSLVIALIGILGLVWFDTRFMQKEIALRKVNGATVREILAMINRKYMAIAGVGFLIAAPLAYAICQRWMSQFAYRTSIPAWIFLASLLAVVAITLAVVSLQGWRAASANPVESLKNE